MDDTTRKIAKLVPGSSERAPFVYFDGVAACGTNAGNVHIELAANTVVPDGRGGTRFDIVITAHLRGSKAAALALRNAIDRALAAPASKSPLNS